MEENDDVLFREGEIVPSSGFAESVMDAVRRDAAGPSPIPFPWNRALPGAAAAGLAIFLGLREASKQAQMQSEMVARIARPSVPSLAPLTLYVAEVVKAVNGTQSVWIGSAMLLALASIAFSMHLVSGRR